MDFEVCWRDVAGGRNEKQAQEVYGEGKEGKVLGEEVAWEVYEGYK